MGLSQGAKVAIVIIIIILLLPIILPLLIGVLLVGAAQTISGNGTATEHWNGGRPSLVNYWQHGASALTGGAYSGSSNAPKANRLATVTTNIRDIRPGRENYNTRDPRTRSGTGRENYNIWDPRTRSGTGRY